VSATKIVWGQITVVLLIVLARQAFRRTHVNRRPIGTPDRHPKGTPASYVLSD
jgi:hypothetical protein